MISICRNCGANLEPGATKCRRCGAEVTEEPAKKSEAPQDSREGLRSKWLFVAAAVVGLLVLVLILTAVILSVKNKNVQPEIEPPVATAVPTPPPAVVETAAPTPEPQVAWADIYRSFLETDPTVNTQLVANAEEYGFEGTMTAELFALADVDSDGIPELLLATRSETLPGWNVSSQQGQAVERFLVCGISDGRVSPLMCGKVDFGFYPLALSVNGQWILEQNRIEDSGHEMLFRSPEGQSGSRALRYEITVEPRLNSAGESCSVPVERWFLNGERIVADKALDTLFPQEAETLNYSPIFFRKLGPGCLDTLETDWENREILQLGRSELSKLRSAAGADWVNQDSSGLPCISEPYCISLTNDGESWVMVVGIDQAEGWDYVDSIQVEAVSTPVGDAWINEATDEALPEGQVYQYVVGIDAPAEQQPPLNTQLRILFHDGTQITREYQTQAPQS